MPVEPGEPIVGTSYVAPLVELFGDVRIGERSFVASDTILRTAPEQQVTIGSETNAQDNIIVRALEDSSTVGDRTSLAHHDIIRDSQVGDFAFVGFNAEIVNSTLENGAFVLHGASVQNVTIPENKLVGPGEEITTQEQADALPEADASTKAFREGVLDVNAEFAEGYIELYETVVNVTSPTPLPRSTSRPSRRFRSRSRSRSSSGSSATSRSGRTLSSARGRPSGQTRAPRSSLARTPTSADDVVFTGRLRWAAGPRRGPLRRLRHRRGRRPDRRRCRDRRPGARGGGELSFTIPAGSVIPDGFIITDEASLQQAIAGNPVTGD